MNPSSTLWQMLMIIFLCPPGMWRVSRFMKEPRRGILSVQCWSRLFLYKPLTQIIALHAHLPLLLIGKAEHDHHDQEDFTPIRASSRSPPHGCVPAHIPDCGVSSRSCQPFPLRCAGTIVPWKPDRRRNHCRCHLLRQCKGLVFHAAFQNLRPSMLH